MFSITHKLSSSTSSIQFSMFTNSKATHRQSLIFISRREEKIPYSHKLGHRLETRFIKSFSTLQKLFPKRPWKHRQVIKEAKFELNFFNLSLGFHAWLVREQRRKVFFFTNFQLKNSNFFLFLYLPAKHFLGSRNR